MTKEYTGPEFEIEFARAWLKYVEGGKVGVDPKENWEVHDDMEKWLKSFDWPHFDPESRYRWKPTPTRRVTIGYPRRGETGWNGKTLVAPEVEAPAMGTVFYRYKDPHHVQRWCGGKQDYLDLKTGEIFLAREDAQAMSDWLAICRKGGQS